MRRLQGLVVAACFCSVTVVVAQEGDVAKELKKLAGTWTIVSAEKSGEKPPAGELDGVRVIIAGNKIAFKKDDKLDGEEGTFKLDLATKPKQIDLMGKDKLLQGIYELSGDTLKICASAPGEARPTKFASPEGSKTFLLILKRAKE